MKLSLCSPIREHWRSVGAAVALVACAVAFAIVLNEHYPLRHWLLWHYTLYWALATLFGAACLSGYAIVVAMRPAGLAGLWFAEQLALGFAIGVLVFALGVFVAGQFGVLGTAFFFAWPTFLALVGLRAAVRDARAGMRHRMSLSAAAREWLPRTSLQWCAGTLIVIGLAILYLQVLAPENLGYDARWYHMPIAAHYVALGRIEPFAEGWYLGAYPQLTSLLYTWAFLFPSDRIFDHVTLAVHLEWVLFLATIACVPVLVRRLLHGRRLRGAAAAIFLFPGLFVYDSNLIGGADHVLAFWGCPAAIAVGAAIRRPGVLRSAVAAAVLAGAALTKYQALYLLVPAGFVLTIGLLRRRALWAITTLPVAGLVLTAPHWLKNYFYYGNPIFPLGSRVFAQRPSYPGADEAMLLHFTAKDFTPTGSVIERLLASARAALDFSFVPRDLWDFHHDVPFFGSLFTLLMIPLLFARRTGRVWLLIASVHMGVFIWFWTNHQERFLQALVPLMAASVAAAMSRLWSLGLASRIGITLLVCLQLVWGAGAPFSGEHRLAGGSAIKEAIDHLGSGYHKRYRDRFQHWNRDFVALGRRVPRGERVLLHDAELRLGLPCPVVSDTVGFQARYGYETFHSPEAVWRDFRAIGITHLIWEPGGVDRKDPTSLAREAMFQMVVQAYSDPIATEGPFRLRRLRLRKPATPPRTQIAVSLCNDESLKSGMYSVSDLAKAVRPRRPIGDLNQKLVQEFLEVGVLLRSESCQLDQTFERFLHLRFDLMAQRGDIEIWVRKVEG